MAAKVLIISDAEPDHLLGTAWLKKYGYQPVCVPNGESALKALECEPFDLVITKLRLPGLGGLELLDAMRARGLTTPAILYAFQHPDDLDPEERAGLRRLKGVPVLFPPLLPDDFMSWARVLTPHSPD